MRIEPEYIVEFAQRNCLTVGAAAIALAAENRGIAWTRLGCRNCLQLSQGSLQRFLKGTITSNTSRRAMRIAWSKRRTIEILFARGLPVPVQEVVHSAEEAAAAARRMGYPIVVKPVRGNHGRGISVAVLTEKEVVVAFIRAAKHCAHVLVGNYVPGNDHRILVANGVFVAAVRRIPGHIIGNGSDRIATLIENVNRDPLRGIGHENVLTRIMLDEEAERMLKIRGYTFDSVPHRDEVVFLRSYANTSAGGTSIDVTDSVHPDNKMLAEVAVNLIGLDIGGVDFITSDISKSHREVGGAICEVNAGPGLRLHLSPTEGMPRDVASPIVDMLFSRDPFFP
jgi:cyanophycin synthetase